MKWKTHSKWQFRWMWKLIKKTGWKRIRKVVSGHPETKQLAVGLVCHFDGGEI